MSLGAFSVSLTVKDLEKSIAFYKALGFSSKHETCGEGWHILTNGVATIGLFQGMFDKNILTFNPGWDQTAQAVDPFEDVRAIQKRLQDAGIELAVTADETTTGPAHIVLEDPDGNQIMFDQHR